MKRFWNWLTPQETSPNSDGGERVLRINGVIAEESWLDDDITPAVFASELNAGSGPVTIWLNSPGGDVGPLLVSTTCCWIIPVKSR